MTNALIEELQAGPGSRELSDRVLLALGWRKVLRDAADDDPNQHPVTILFSPENQGYGVNTNYHWTGRQRPDPSRNLQDAVDLVPEGMLFAVGLSEDGPYCQWEVHNHCDDGLAPTPALAICIAIIKARSL